jgi:hypothetical protein
MTTQNSRISSLASVLQSTISPSALGFRGSLPLEATWRQFGGRDYFIVLNLSTKSVSRTMRVQGVRPTDAFTVIGEIRKVGVVLNTFFTDSFGPYQVHIYRSP